MTTHRDNLNSDEVANVEGKIKKFGDSDAAFAKLRKLSDPNSLSAINDQLDLWGKYRPARDASPEAKFKADAVAALKQGLEQ